MTPDHTDHTGSSAASARAGTRLLEELGDELSARGFKVRLSLHGGRPPRLHVLNPAAAALAEDILAEEGPDGWWYRWSWSEPIAPASEVAAVAERVARVLAAR